MDSHSSNEILKQSNLYSQQYLQSHVDYLRKVMSHDRFLLLLKFLHLSDTEKYISFGQAWHDHLYKIRPIITYLIAQFKLSYTPNHNYSVDESIISYKGCLSILQYLSKKPYKWGIKA